MSVASKRLLERYCRNGDQAAFNTFYRSQADRLWRFLRARGCDPERAYDLLSDTFLRFLQVICRDLRSPLGLLYRIAINLHIDSYRRNSRSPVSADNEAVDAASADAEVYSTEAEYLRRLMKTLPESEQNLLLMRYWIGLSHKEIAITMEKPEGTVRRQCAGALQTLRQRWQEEQDE